MGILDRFRKPIEERSAIEQYFKMLTAYAPAYSTYQGGIYEMALTRAAIHTFATHCGKLSPKIVGSARRDLGSVLQFKPNPTMDAYTFLYKLATIVKTENTAFIVPTLDEYERPISFWPVRSVGSEIKYYNNKQWLLYAVPGSTRKEAIELEKVGILRNHYYKQDIYGDGNNALDSTLDLMYTQDQGIINGIQNSANIRFLARLANILKPEDVKKERQRFVTDNLGTDNNGGVMLFDQKYADVKQIESKQLLIDDKQASLIRQNVYEYLGVNEDILQNKFNEDTWNAYYEGAIEPFAIQLSLVLTNLVYTSRERANKNAIMFEANRLQYASNTTKINLVTQLFDRGFITHNIGREIFNMAPITDGDKLLIRREYMELNEMGAKTDEPVAAISLNGAQITSLLEIIQSVAAGTLSYNGAIAIIVSAFPFDEAKAKAMLDDPSKLKVSEKAKPVSEEVPTDDNPEPGV